MFCYHNKQLLSALGLVLKEFNANKKCQVSLAVKYIKLVIVKSIKKSHFQSRKHGSSTQ